MASDGSANRDGQGLGSGLDGITERISNVNISHSRNPSNLNAAAASFEPSAYYPPAIPNTPFGGIPNMAFGGGPMVPSMPYAPFHGMSSEQVNAMVNAAPPMSNAPGMSNYQPPARPNLAPRMPQGPIPPPLNLHAPPTGPSMTSTVLPPVPQHGTMPSSTAMPISAPIPQHASMASSTAIPIPAPAPVPINPFIQPLTDLRTLPLPIRTAMAVKPFIEIIERHHHAGGIPLAILLSISPLFQSIFAQDPHIKIWHIDTAFLSAPYPHGTRGPMATIIAWLRSNTRPAPPGIEEWIPMPVKSSMKENLMVMRAARQLGIEEKYYEGILRKYMGYVIHRIPTFPDMALIEFYALDRTDPLYAALAHTLCRLRFKQQLLDPSELAKWLEKHAKLAAFMDQIDAEYEEKRRRAREEREEREKRWGEKKEQ